MTDPAIATRYAHVVFQAAKTEGCVDAIREQLAILRDLLAREPSLRQFLRNPDVESEDKVGVLERVLQGRCLPLLRSALSLIVSFGRAEALADIVTAFEAAVDADANRLRVTVRSARELPGPILSRLRGILARREGKHVELSADVDASLIGGIQVVLGHRVIDGSVQRELANLKQRLTTIRVH